MIKTISGTCWPVFSGLVLSMGFALITGTAHAAPVCENLFSSSTATRPLESRDTSDQLRLPFRIDPSTRQKRAQTMVSIREDRQLYIDYLEPAPGKPIIVLVNGLTYRTAFWDAFVRELQGDGLGILRYDPRGMGKTMESEALLKAPVTVSEQVKDLASLLNSMGIRQQVHLLGLSYGGAIVTEFAATYPNRIASVMPTAAYTEPLRQQADQIRLQISYTRILQPWNKATDRELYSYFLRQTVYSTYPLSEPVVLEHPYKLESVFQLADGATEYRSSAFVGKLPKGKVFQIDAAKDEYIPSQIHDEFWASIPVDARGARLLIDGSKHKIPEVMPITLAAWVKLIIAKDPRIQNGEVWTGGIFDGKFTSPTTQIKFD